MLNEHVNTLTTIFSLHDIHITIQYFTHNSIPTITARNTKKPMATSRQDSRAEDKREQVPVIDLHLIVFPEIRHGSQKGRMEGLSR